MASDQHRIGPADQLNGQGNKILHAAKLPPNALPNAQVIPPSMNRVSNANRKYQRRMWHHHFIRFVRVFVPALVALSEDDGERQTC